MEWILKAKESTILKKVEHLIHWKQRQKEQEEAMLKEQHERHNQLIQKYVDTKVYIDLTIKPDRDLKELIQVEIINFDTFNQGREGIAYLEALEKAVIQLQGIEKVLKLREMTDGNINGRIL